MSNNLLEKYKARVVVKGYDQVDEIDYIETFSYIIKLQTIRVVLTLALAKGKELKQLDVNNAFSMENFKK